jgi:hypothetical protein
MVLHTRGRLISKPMAAIWNSLQHWKRCSAALQLKISLCKGSSDLLLIFFPDYISLKVCCCLSSKKNLYEILLQTRLTYLSFLFFSFFYLFSKINIGLGGVRKCVSILRNIFFFLFDFDSGLRECLQRREI